MKKYLLFIFMMFVTLVANAQENEMDKEKEEKYRHRITVMMANSHIPNMQSTDAQNKFSIVPTWGFDYDFWFNKKWAIGLHNDLVLQQYKIIKEEDSTEVERSYPIGTCIVGIYQPFKHLAFATGIGKEFEKHESFSMWKIGIEYEFELPKAWELSLNLQYDTKFNAYDSWLFGLGIGKRFH
jgi:hypothetical protein